jgi:hypothetical protein
MTELQHEGDPVIQPTTNDQARGLAHEKSLREQQGTPRERVDTSDLARFQFDPAKAPAKDPLQADEPPGQPG